MQNKIIGKVAPVFLGEYDNEHVYSRLDIVLFEGQSWVCLYDNTVDITPGVGGTWRMVSERGYQGVQGVVGPQGDRGYQGYQGDKPVVNAKSGELVDTVGTPTVTVEHVDDQTVFVFNHLKGVQGAQGKVGTQGQKGFQGTIGYQGYQGNQGNQGNQGSQGEKGNQGQKGAQGIAGRIGLQGYQGSQGLKGDQGIKGDQGTQGDNGFQGFQGNQGVQGTIGIRGFQGVQGMLGHQGHRGFQGERGYQGREGNSLNMRQSKNQCVFIGDAYFDEEDGHLYVFDGEGFIDAGNIRGFQGNQGNQGDRGTKWFFGGELNNEDVNNGDCYLNTITNQIYTVVKINNTVRLLNTHDFNKIFTSENEWCPFYIESEYLHVDSELRYNHKITYSELDSLGGNTTCTIFNLDGTSETFSGNKVSIVFRDTNIVRKNEPQSVNYTWEFTSTVIVDGQSFSANVIVFCENNIIDPITEVHIIKLGEEALYKSEAAEDWRTQAVGGVAGNLKPSDFNKKTVSQVLDMILYPTLQPKLTYPTMTVKAHGKTATTTGNLTTASMTVVNKNGMVIASLPGEKLYTCSYTRGTSEYGNMDGTTELTGTPVVKSEPSFDGIFANEGIHTTKYEVTFGKGKELKDNKGGLSTTAPYAEKTGVVNVVYHTIKPIFITTGSTILDVVEQSIDDKHDYLAGSITLDVTCPKETEENKFEIHIPNSLSGITSVKGWNPVANDYNNDVNMIYDGEVTHGILGTYKKYVRTKTPSDITTSDYKYRVVIPKKV